MDWSVTLYYKVLSNTLSVRLFSNGKGHDEGGRRCWRSITTKNGMDCESLDWCVVNLVWPSNSHPWDLPGGSPAKFAPDSVTAERFEGFENFEITREIEHFFTSREWGAVDRSVDYPLSSHFNGPLFEDQQCSTLDGKYTYFSWEMFTPELTQLYLVPRSCLTDQWTPERCKLAEFESHRMPTTTTTMTDYYYPADISSTSVLLHHSGWYFSLYPSPQDC